MFNDARNCIVGETQQAIRLVYIFQDISCVNKREITLPSLDLCRKFESISLASRARNKKKKIKMTKWYLERDWGWYKGEVNNERDSKRKSEVLSDTRLNN